MRQAIILLTAGSAIILLALAFFVFSKNTGSPINDDILVKNQKAGSKVVVDSATLSTNGFVVIHESDNGKPGNIAGVSSLLGQGNNQLIFVPANTTSDKTYFAVLHEDDGNGLFEPQKDLLMRNADGGQIQTEFTVKK